MSQHLLQHGTFTLSSGKPSMFKLECEALTEDDWWTIAAMIARACDFGSVIGVPRGGLLLASELEPFVSETGPRLVVDDVLTTGGSILKLMRPGDIGWVVFARGPLPSNVNALFRLHPRLWDT